MSEIYGLAITQGRPTLTPLAADLPPALNGGRFNPETSSGGYAITCRMGDPDLLECIVWRRQGETGAVFALRDKNDAICFAIAKSGLEYAAGLSLFGEMTANARYGVDIFENMEEPDD